MVVDYGMALEFDRSSLIKALLIVQFVGFPATLLVVKLADIWDAKMILQKYAAEFFGFYDLLGKFAVILGPLLVGIVALFSHNSRIAIASVAILFILGRVLLFFVDEKKVAKDVREALGS